MFRCALASALVLAAFARQIPAQRPDDFVPPGWIRLGDQCVPPAALFGDSAWTAIPWQFGIVPYDFDPNVSAANRTRTLDAMAELEAAAGIDWVPRTSQADFVRIRAATFNQSAVGQAGGMQTISISSWTERFVIVHEMLHCLGFIHEHQRPDRNIFVTINTANIFSGQEGDFTLISNATTASAYDFASNMHYGACFFSSDCNPPSVCAGCTNQTISVNAAYSASAGLIGNRSYLSQGDAQGLQARYGSPLPPSAASVSPSAIAAGSIDPVITVTGARFCGGSTTAGAVPGTVVRWNGISLATTYLSPTQVSAVVPASFVSVPTTAQITVLNAAPGGGLGTGTPGVSVTCASVPPIALVAGTPQTISSPCTGFSIPTPVSTSWHVAAISSTSDWDMTIGTGSSTLGGSNADFLAADGAVSPGQQVSPTAGTFYRYSGTDAATVEYTTATAMTVGTPFITGIGAGSIVRAVSFLNSPGAALSISVTGAMAGRWWLVWGPATFAWQGTGTALASGFVGAPPQTFTNLFGGRLCLVVCRSGGAAAAFEGFTINVCPPVASVAIGAGSLPTITNACQPFTISPQAGRWNAVGVSSASDWDIGLGPAVSEFGGSSCDYVVANGRLGAISPAAGNLARYSGASAAAAMHPVTVAANGVPGAASVFTSMMCIFEFQVANAGNYDIGVNAGAGSGYSWDLHLPGASAAWRRRADRSAGSFAANGTPATGLALAPGWHAVVVVHDGGASAQVNVAMSISLSALQPPLLAAILPSAALAGSGGFNLSVVGQSFTASSLVRWNGSPLPTSFASSSLLTAQIAASLLAAPGTAQVSVETPALGISGNLGFSIQNGVPSIASFVPASAVAGQAPFTLRINGAGFVSGSEARWDGVPLATTLVSATQLDAAVAPAQLLRAAAAAITVFNPSPGGGLSAAASYAVDGPAIASMTPATIAIQGAGAPSFVITIIGPPYMLPISTVHADGRALPTTLVNPTTLTATFDPALFPQAAAPGGIAVNVQNTLQAVSNSRALVVGSGGNQGTVRLHPLAPAPTAPFELRVEGGVAARPLTLIADLGAPAPVFPFPSAAANLVLGVTSFAGSAGPVFPLADGTGLFGASDGTAFANGGALGGVYTFSGLVMPPAPLGAAARLQGVYLDPAAPGGFRLTWTRRVDL